MRKFDWWLVPFVILMVSGAVLGFWIGSVFSVDWNAVAAQRSDMRRACIEGNDRACRMYEVEYGR
ncbi:hypothetical protein [Stenotrophomonas maltophilia]|uniref:hypothetical protein n=1 Tax=Stenotrophomonas maltophilia TaxID=40324 RepID=UPI0006AC837F|nr:hypothetical protein [Stenotrophomonas maltophilia]KOQ76638.1 hypothetical protein ABW44_03615 [Stenotrophomonas maltophilia]